MCITKFGMPQNKAKKGNRGAAKKVTIKSTFKSMAVHHHVTFSTHSISFAPEKLARCQFLEIEGKP